MDKLSRLRAEFALTGDPEVARQIADIEQPSAPPKAVKPKAAEPAPAEPDEPAEAPRGRRKAH